MPKPDPGSAAARREKRAAKGAYARKSDDVEDFTGGVDAMGGGDDELQRLLAKNKRRTDRRQVHITVSMMCGGLNEFFYV